ncbi:MAG: hypothetical protein ACFFCZ_26185 [Promethearchaeota archaeon]
MVLDEIQTKASHSLLQNLLTFYKAESMVAQLFAAVGSFICSSFGGTQERANFVAKTLESFFLASSIHDDAVDIYDTEKGDYPTSLQVISGDIFFVSLAKYLALATRDVPLDSAKKAIDNLIKYLRIIGKYQVLERKTNIRSANEALVHTRYLGAIQGRMAVEFGATLGSTATDEDITQAGDIGEKLFFALTIRDDLSDLIDDLANGVFTWPVCLMYERKDELLAQQKLSKEEVDLLVSGVSQGKIEDAKTVYLMLKKTGILEMVNQKVDAQLAEALEILNQAAKRRNEEYAMKWFVVENILQNVVPETTKRSIKDLEEKLSL